MCIFSAFLALAATSAPAARAQNVAATQASTQPKSIPLPRTGVPQTLQTHLRVFLLPGAATEEGYATVRVFNEEGEVVYRGMKLLAAGARTLDLSSVGIPAAGNHTLHVIYPGGLLIQELSMPYVPPAASDTEVAAGR